MNRIYRLRIAVLVAAAVLLSGNVLAQQVSPHLSSTNRFTHLACEVFLGCVTTSSGACNCHQRILQEQVYIQNPGTAGGVSPGGDLCADIYVFTADQSMAACCGCKITPDGLLTLGLRSELIGNSLTGAVGASGTIRIVSSAPILESCDPSKPRLKRELIAWATHLQVNSIGVSELTETAFKNAPLSASEFSKLENQCGFIQSDGSGHGICSCGTPTGGR